GIGGRLDNFMRHRDGEIAKRLRRRPLRRHRALKVGFAVSVKIPNRPARAPRACATPGSCRYEGVRPVRHEHLRAAVLIDVARQVRSAVAVVIANEPASTVRPGVTPYASRSEATARGQVYLGTAVLIDVTREVRSAVAVVIANEPASTVRSGVTPYAGGSEAMSRGQVSLGVAIL